ncbi:MAG: ribose 5-phosphate isomerase B [Acholeplasmatales bacterium]|nr:MAG: ribose 5-phosphate isomerase B [Acholeplasmatales bacterium]
MKVMIGADHGGYALKQTIVRFLQEQGHEVHDAGTHGTEACDYNDAAKDVALAVRAGTVERGILICGTGVGMSIQANKFQGIRAALVSDVYTAEATRAHNDSNILTMGGRVVGEGLALKIVATWINTPFSGEARHARRIAKLENNQ